MLTTQVSSNGILAIFNDGNVLNTMKKNTWIPLNTHPELWLGQYIVPNFVSNSVALKVDDHNYVLVSPGKQMLDAWPDDRKGEQVQIHIIMPNGFHYMGVSAWQAVFPNAKLYASQDAIPRLLDKGIGEPGFPQGIRALQNERPPLPAQYDILFPPGHREGEVWVRKRDPENGTTWITCDSFLNYERYSNQPIARFLQKLLNAAPGLKLSQVIKFFILKNRQSFKQWALDQVGNDQPTTLIPSHGEVAQRTSLASEITALLNKRL